MTWNLDTNQIQFQDIQYKHNREFHATTLFMSYEMNFMFPNTITHLAQLHKFQPIQGNRIRISFHRHSKSRTQLPLNPRIISKSSKQPNVSSNLSKNKGQSRIKKSQHLYHSKNKDGNTICKQFQNHKWNVQQFKFKSYLKTQK